MSLPRPSLHSREHFVAKGLRFSSGVALVSHLGGGAAVAAGCHILRRFSDELQPFSQLGEYAAVRISHPPEHIRAHNFPLLPKILTCPFTNRMD